MLVIGSDVSARDQHQSLIEAASQARERAVAPFSHFRVGAALETADGRIFAGCNVESAAYGLTVCAERVAVWKALSEGARGIKRLAVFADAEPLTPPCGACRQIIWEFGGNAMIVLANLRGTVETYEMQELYPRAFDAQYLTGNK